MTRKSFAAFLSILFALLSSTSNAQSRAVFNKPQSSGYLAAAAFKAGTLRLQAGSFTTRENPNLTCSPTPCIFTPVRVSNLGSSMVENGPIAVNPANSLQLLSGGNDFNCANIQGWYASSDGGSTWKDTCAPGSGGQGDPIVAYDAKNIAYAGGIQNNVIVVSSSTNNGQTWGTPVKAVTDELGYLADKPWLEADTNAGSPFENALYLSTTQFAPDNSSQIWVAHSADGGKTWSDKAVSSLAGFPGHANQFSDLTVGPDGTVYVTWLNCPTTGPAGDCGGTVANIMISKSTDGGNTWSSEVRATTTHLVPDACMCAFYGNLPNTSDPVSNIPVNTVALSGTSAVVYVTYYNWTGTQMRIFVITSSDGGSTWGTAFRVSKSNVGDQFFQWINIASLNRKLSITWLDRRNDPANVKYQPFFATSINGTAFTKDHALSSNLFNPTVGSSLGEYYGNAWDGKTLYVMWPDTSSGTPQATIGGVQF